MSTFADDLDALFADDAPAAKDSGPPTRAKAPRRAALAAGSKAAPAPAPKAKRGRPAAEQPEDLALKEARTRAANATAALAEMKREISSGALVRREDVAAAWAAIMTDLRAALLGIPARLDCDPATRAAVDRELRDTLNRIADNA